MPLHASLMDEVSDEVITQQYAALDMVDYDEEEKMVAFYQEAIKPLDRIYIEIFKEDRAMTLKRTTTFQNEGSTPFWKYKRNR